MDRDTARETYERRSEETRTITGLGKALVQTDDWTTGAGAEQLLAAGVQVGDRIVFETVLATQIVGARREGEQTWIYRKTTDQLIEEHEAMLAGFERERHERLDASRAQWQHREEALPEWLRARLRTFHERGGDRFALDGWGYELMICEIAAGYAADQEWLTEAAKVESFWDRSSLPDPAPVAKIAHDEGTTGNMHQVAQALALAHAADPDRSMAGTISALSPLTGDADYSGRDDA